MSTVQSQASVRWRKSSYSGDAGGSCVECAVLGPVNWAKSSFSGDGECVEVAIPGAVLIRDSKDPSIPHLTVSAAAFSAFVRTASRTPLAD